MVRHCEADSDSYRRTGQSSTFVSSTTLRESTVPGTLHEHDKSELDEIERLEDEREPDDKCAYVRRSWHEQWKLFVSSKDVQDENAMQLTCGEPQKHPGPFEAAAVGEEDVLAVSTAIAKKLSEWYPKEGSDRQVAYGPGHTPSMPAMIVATSNSTTVASLEVESIRLRLCVKRPGLMRSTTSIRQIPKQFLKTAKVSEVLTKSAMDISRGRYYLFDPSSRKEYDPKDQRTLAEIGFEDNTVLFILPQSEAGRKAGKVGLINIGNTCYMNSSLQCLLHTPELMYYFLNEVYKLHIRKDNPDGCKGQFAQEFYNLMRSVWLADSDLTSPYKFWLVLSEYYALFAEKDQHDTAELAETVLDGLMEDCNQAIIPKPYLPEINEDAKMSDHETAEFCWNYHKGRSSSFITDKFHGQYRIVTKCPKCGYEVRKFDSFTILHVGLPPPKRRIIIFTLVEICGDQLPKKFAVELSSDRSVEDLYLKAAELVKCEEDEPWNQLCFVLDRKKRLTFLQRHDSLEHIKDHQTLLLYSYRGCEYGPCSGGRRICFIHQKRTPLSYSTGYYNYSFSTRIEEKREFGYPLVLFLPADEDFNLSKKRAFQGNLDILENSLRPYKRQHNTIMQNRKQLKEEPMHPEQSQDSNKMECEGSEVGSTHAEASSAAGSPRSDPDEIVEDSGVHNVEFGPEENPSGTPNERESASLEEPQDGNANEVEMETMTTPSHGEIHPEPLSSPPDASNRYDDQSIGESDPYLRNLFDSPQADETHTETYAVYRTTFDSSSAVAASSSSSSVTQFRPCSPSEPYSLSESRSTVRADEATTFVIDWDSSSADQHYNLQSLERVLTDRSAECAEERRRRMMDSVTIEDCLNHEFSPHPCALDGDNLWKCGSCGKMVNGIKSMRLWRAPDILLIGLKRFDYCEERDRLIKLKQLVTFPLEGLDLREFYAPKQENDSIYDLYGVCHHLGEGPKLGHYTSCVKSPGGRWHKFNDSFVSEVDEHSVVSQDAYLLYYRKKNLDVPTEQEVLNLLQAEERRQLEDHAVQLYETQFQANESTNGTLSVQNAFNYGKDAFSAPAENGSSSSNEMNNENDIPALSSHGQGSSSSLHAGSLSNSGFSVHQGPSSSAFYGPDNRTDVLMSSEREHGFGTCKTGWPSQNSEKDVEAWNRGTDTTVGPSDVMEDNAASDPDVLPSGWHADSDSGTLHRKDGSYDPDLYSAFENDEHKL